MAKRKKAGWVYLIRVKSDGHVLRPHLYKIGVTKQRDIHKRFGSISRSTKDEDKLLCYDWVGDCKKLERKLHDQFADKRRYLKELKGNGGTEVFRLNVFDRMSAVTQIRSAGAWRKTQALIYLAGAALLIYHWDTIQTTIRSWLGNL